MKSLKNVVVGILCLYLLLMGLLHVFQEKIIFLPDKISKDYVYDFPFKFDEVSVKTADGVDLNALHIKATNPKGIILYFHGNKGNLTRWGPITSYFTQFNYDVFVVDYRGYGKSSGDFNEEGMYKDALRCYEYIKKTYKEEQIVVYGRSLGTTFAAKVASVFRPKHVVLEAPFYSLHQAANYKYKVIPQFLLKFKFDTHLLMPKIQRPISIFHGTSDQITPSAGSQELFDLLKGTRKSLFFLENGTHHNVREFKEYTDALKLILD